MVIDEQLAVRDRVKRGLLKVEILSADSEASESTRFLTLLFSTIGGWDELPGARQFGSTSAMCRTRVPEWLWCAPARG